MSTLWELIQQLKDKILQREKPEKKPERSEEFKEALQFVLKWEGFISNDPQDAGGLTIWGISYRSHKEAVLEIERLINEQKKDEAFKIAEDIYYENYWLPMNCDNLQYPMDCIIFDTSVNMGKGKAKELLASSNDWKDYLLLRLYAYSKLKQAKLYFRGWANRTLDLYNLIKEKGFKDD